MRYQVNKLSRDKCKIILFAENSIDNELIASSNEALLEQHYQKAIKIKFGARAHFICVVETESPDKLTAMFVIE